MISIPRLCLGLVVAVAALCSSAPARADSSCGPLVANITSQLVQRGGTYAFDLTIHRTNVNLVTYSKGQLGRSGGAEWPLVGSANQLFSDRMAGSQPFNVNAADHLNPYIGSTGLLYLWYTTWAFSTTWDMKCIGQTMTQVVPNYGVVTLTFRNWVAP